jgi:hypothetical protein
MRETRTSGLTSGDGNRSDASLAQATAPVLDSTRFCPNQPESADSLTLSILRQGHSVREAKSRSAPEPGVCLAQAHASYRL